MFRVKLKKDITEEQLGFALFGDDWKEYMTKKNVTFNLEYLKTIGAKAHYEYEVVLNVAVFENQNDEKYYGFIFEEIEIWEIVEDNGLLQ